jgi:hypothetical protein
MASSGTEWAYANNARMAVVFLSLAILLLAVGVLAVQVMGTDAALAAATLLTIATFLLVFSALVFLPRLARRGGVSFSVYSRRSLDDAELAVRAVIEAAGRSPQVRVPTSRRGRPRPVRIVTADGIPARFRIESARNPAAADGGVGWTEIIESYGRSDEAEALALREKITARLGVAGPPVT